MTRPLGLSSRSAFTIADDASYLAGCAKDFKTSAEASRITAEWMPRETASMRSRSTSRLAQRRGCSGHNTGAEMVNERKDARHRLACGFPLSLTTNR